MKHETFATAQRHLVVLAHPVATSFNHGIAETYCAAVRGCGQTAVLRDLYALGFDPRLKQGERPDMADVERASDVTAELDLVRGSDVIVLVYPIWFGMPPAILKGYVDRVLGAAAADSLAGKKLVLFTSSATTRPWIEGQPAALHETFDRYLVDAFGMASSEHIHFDAIVEGMSERFVYDRLEDVLEKAREICAARPARRHRALAPARAA